MYLYIYICISEHIRFSQQTQNNINKRMEPPDHYTRSQQMKTNTPNEPPDHYTRTQQKASSKPPCHHTHTQRKTKPTPHLGSTIVLEIHVF